MYKTTKKDFEDFKKEARKWIDYFNLYDWEICFFHSHIDYRSYVNADHNGKIAVFTLSTIWEQLTYKEEVKRVAFHEVCELLLYKLTDMAEDYYNRNRVEEVTHSIIRRLEKCIFWKGGDNMPRKKGACGGTPKRDGSGKGVGNRGTKRQPKK